MDSVFGISGARNKRFQLLVQSCFPLGRLRITSLIPQLFHESVTLRLIVSLQGAFPFLLSRINSLINWTEFLCYRENAFVIFSRSFKRCGRKRDVEGKVRVDLDGDQVHWENPLWRMRIADDALTVSWYVHNQNEY